MIRKKGLKSFISKQVVYLIANGGGRLFEESCEVAMSLVFAMIVQPAE